MSIKWITANARCKKELQKNGRRFPRQISKTSLGGYNNLEYTLQLEEATSNTNMYLDLIGYYILKLFYVEIMRFHETFYPYVFTASNKKIMLKNGIMLLNNLPTRKFELLLQRIATSESEDTFTKEELQKLCETLKLSNESLQLLIQSITHIYKQSNKVILKPTILQKQITEHLNIDPEKAEEFVKIWSANVQSELGDFENRLKLEDIAWELNLQVADQIDAKQSVPTARLKFDFANSRSIDTDNVTVEMNEMELTQLYQTLESIQIKLDNINTI